MPAGGERDLVGEHSLHVGRARHKDDESARPVLVQVVERHGEGEDRPHALREVVLKEMARPKVGPGQRRSELQVLATGLLGRTPQRGGVHDGREPQIRPAEHEQANHVRGGADRVALRVVAHAERRHEHGEAQGAPDLALAQELRGVHQGGVPQRHQVVPDSQNVAPHQVRQREHLEHAQPRGMQRARRGAHGSPRGLHHASLSPLPSSFFIRLRLRCGATICSSSWAARVSLWLRLHSRSQAECDCERGRQHVRLHVHVHSTASAIGVPVGQARSSFRRICALSRTRSRSLARWGGARRTLWASILCLDSVCE